MASRTKTRKSKGKISKTNIKPRLTKRNKKYQKKMLLEEQLSKNMIKQMSEKTPVVSMGHGIKLLSKSKKNLRKGNMSNAVASLITAVAVLSATGPFSRHPSVKEQRISKAYEGRWTGDPEELMKWHVDEQYRPKLKTRVKKTKKSKTVKRKVKSDKTKTRKTKK